jgi:peptidoglycan/xylan/chitin deacetylase (PgdA/CDA1 family)
MLNFRNTSIAFLVLLALFSVISIYSVVGYFLMAPLVLAYLALMVSGSVFVCSNYYLKVLCRRKTEEKVIAVTFDDGPHPEITPKILDLLKQHQIPGVFFVIGKNVTENQGLMMRMVEEGHLVGNHSFTHSSFFDLWNSRQMLEDVNKAENIVAFATGQRPSWFRPPFGVTNPAVAKLVAMKGFQVMGWSIRSLDTSIKDPQKIVARIKKKWQPGGIILLHDTNERSLTVLKKIIDHAIKEGYTFARADEF